MCFMNVFGFYYNGSEVVQFFLNQMMVYGICSQEGWYWSLIRACILVRQNKDIGIVVDQVFGYFVYMVDSSLKEAFLFISFKYDVNYVRFEIRVVDVFDFVQVFIGQQRGIKVDEFSLVCINIQNIVVVVQYCIQ